MQICMQEKICIAMLSYLMFILESLSTRAPTLNQSLHLYVCSKPQKVFHLIFTVTYTATYCYLLTPQQTGPISTDPQLQQTSQ